MTPEEKSLIRIAVNNDDELCFLFDVDGMIDLESLDVLYVIAGKLDIFKGRMLNLIEEIEHYEDDDEEHDCENCDEYDECDSPQKKKRDGDITDGQLPGETKPPDVPN